MGMDLNEKCHHCDAEIGKFCEENCHVNGKNIQLLKETFLKLNLKYDENVLLKLSSYNGKK